MEGYRTSLIRAAAGFDTYQSMRAFAEHPDRYSKAAFNCLLDRCAQAIAWDITARLPGQQPPDALLRLRTGARDWGRQTAKRISLDMLAEGTDEERRRFYMQCMEAAGVSVDSEGRTTDREQAQNGHADS